MQPGYPEHLLELLGLLRDWIACDGAIDFVVHAGDIVDACSPESIREAVSAFQFDVPFHACLGNHDLTRADARDRWLEGAPQWFVSGSIHYEIVRPDCIVHIVPNHWDDVDFWWRDVQSPRFSQAQVARIDGVIARHPDRAHVLCTHSPVLGVLPAQTGWPEAVHVPPEAFSGTVLDLVRRHSQLCCVLSGHNHTNTLAHCDGSVLLSASAFASVPFEFKVIEIGEGALSVTTHDVSSGVGFETEYDLDKAFVQGRARDRDCVIRLDFVST